MILELGEACHMLWYGMPHNCWLGASAAPSGRLPLALRGTHTSALNTFLTM